MFGGAKLDALQIKALNRSLAIIEFTPDGVVLDANENFLKVIGYSLADINGRPHAMFIDPDYSRREQHRPG